MRTDWRLVKYSPVMDNYSLEGVGLDAAGRPDRSTVSTSTHSRTDALERLGEGGVFIDCAGMDHRVFASGVIRGPLVDVRVDAAPIDPCPQPSDYFTAAVAGNAFGSLLAIHQADKARRPAEPGPLDSVDLATFAAYWQARGARILRKRSGELIAD